MAAESEVYSARNNATLAGIMVLPLGEIEPSPDNPRRRFDEEALKELAESIKEHGLLQPIIVQPMARASWGALPRYIIIAGERRWRACRLAGLSEIPAIVREDLENDEAAKLRLIENLQRVDLDPLEEAMGYELLNRVVGLKQREIAEAVNRSQSAVANRMRLLKLPDPVKEQLRTGALSPAHGVAIVRFEKYPKIMERIAEISIERQARAKELESGLPFQWDLQKAGLCDCLGHYDVPKGFDPEACRSACPTGDYRAPGQGSSYGSCLNPKCYKAKVAAAKKTEAERVTRAVEKMATTSATQAEELPPLSALPYDSYKRMDGAGNEAPPECRAKTEAGCEHARYGACWDGKPVRICTDPKCWEKLEKAGKAKATREKNQEADRRAEEIKQVVDGMESQYVAPLVAYALDRARILNDKKARARFADLAGFELPPMANAYGRERLQPFMIAFAEMDPVNLVAIALSLIVRWESEATDTYEVRDPGAVHFLWNLGPTSGEKREAEYAAQRAGTKESADEETPAEVDPDPPVDVDDVMEAEADELEAELDQADARADPEYAAEALADAMVEDRPLLIDICESDEEWGKLGGKGAQDD